MSYADDVRAAVVAKMVTAATATEYPVGSDAAKVVEFPAVYPVRGAQENPNRLEHGQSEESTVYPFVAVWKQSDETAEDHWEDFKRRMLIDPTLGGVCRDAWVSEGIFDGFSDEKRVWVAFSVTAQRIQGDA